MFYQLYSNARGFLVTGLVDKGWSFTLSFLQKIGQLNAVYVVASEGSLTERVERFNKLRALGTASEQDKNSFAEGLLLTDRAGRTILCDIASEIAWNANAFKNMLAELEKLGFFSGSQTEERIECFLQALFKRDSY